MALLMKKLFGFITLLLCWQSAAVAVSSEAEKQAQLRLIHFQNIDELIQLRVPGLALNYLQREQPQYHKDDPVEWLFWEQKRIALLRYMKQWQSLIHRVDANHEKLLTPNIATADRNWFITEQLRARVELEQYEQALQQARQLLWSASALVKSKSLAAWRRIIIQVYLNQGLTTDAQTAMRRYQQDYGKLQNEDGYSWLQLQAELLIQLGQYSEAISILRQSDSEEARALQLLAMLKDQAISPLDAFDNAQLILSGMQQDSEGRGIYQYLAMTTAIQLGKTDKAIELLEKILAGEKLASYESLRKLGNTDASVDALWKLYSQFGHQFANRQGLLKGDDEKWYLIASNYFEEQPVIAKSLYAVLAIEAHEESHRQLSMKQLAMLIEKQQTSLKLINLLFTQTRYLSDVAMVPAEVRYKLVDYNLGKGNIEAAAAIMADLKQPPAEQPQFDWNLRRARVLILSGSFQKGAAVLSQILQEGIERAQADRFLQVVFDLQAVEQHALALQLFGNLQQLVDDPVLQREVTFWRAESYAGLKQFDQAAYLFLKSAISPENVYDPWYHTATFRAAESLLDAGLYEDARQRFLHLLKITGNTARKSVIRQRLQSIQLKLQVSDG